MVRAYTSGARLDTRREGQGIGDGCAPPISVGIGPLSCIAAIVSRATAAFVLASVLAAGCTSRPLYELPDASSPLLPNEAELEIGRETHPEILLQYGRYDDEELQGYVQRVGEQLAQVSGSPHPVFRFTVLDSGEVNSFSLPGGYVYVTRGLLAYLNRESELAAILAHEVAHVAAHHASRYMAEVTTADRYISVASLMIPDVSSQIARDALNTLGSVLVTGYGADVELKSHHLAMEILAQAGYDPSALPRILEVLDKAQAVALRSEVRAVEPIVYHGLLPRDTAWELRLSEGVANARSLRVPSEQVTEPERFLYTLDELVWGDNAGEGMVVDGQFFHPEWGCTLVVPTGWKVLNRRAGAVLISEKADAFLQLTAADIPENLAPEVYANTQLGLDNILEGESLSLHGIPAYGMTARTRTPYGYRTTKHYVIYLGAKALHAKIVTRSELSDHRNEAPIQQALHSLRPIAEAEWAQIRSRALRVIPMPPKRSILGLVLEAELPAALTEQIRILNHIPPDTEPGEGRIVKLIQ